MTCLSYSYIRSILLHPFSADAISLSLYIRRYLPVLGLIMPCGSLPPRPPLCVVVVVSSSCRRCVVVFAPRLSRECLFASSIHATVRWQLSLCFLFTSFLPPIPPFFIPPFYRYPSTHFRTGTAAHCHDLLFYSLSLLLLTL
jgi:hypothetical protein